MRRCLIKRERRQEVQAVVKMAIAGLIDPHPHRDPGHPKGDAGVDIARASISLITFTPINANPRLIST